MLFTILLALELAFTALAVVGSLIDGSWDLLIIGNGLGLSVIVLGMLLSELGRQHSGHISPLWMLVIALTSAAALIVAALQLFDEHHDIGSIVASSVMTAAVLATTIYVIWTNSHGRWAWPLNPAPGVLRHHPTPHRTQHSAPNTESEHRICHRLLRTSTRLSPARPQAVRLARRS
ncbi:MAG TPA: hypothetical protein VIP98_02280 [Microlunatus sp.]